MKVMREAEEERGMKADRGTHMCDDTQKEKQRQWKNIAESPAQPFIIRQER